MIRTPPHWGADVLAQAYRSMTTISDAEPWLTGDAAKTARVRRLHLDDLGTALAKGWQDFTASRSDVIFLCVLYPLLGLLLARFAFGYQMLPLVFPLASGFALLGPLAGVGLNEMSRRRELGLSAGWADAFKVVRSPSIRGIALLGIVLMLIFLFWLVTANVIYNLTLGPQPPVSLDLFIDDILYTTAGHVMVVFGCGVGFLFAALAMTISVVSFPMLLDRNVSLETAVRTSIEVVRRNPRVMAVWGLVIAGGLVLGSIPLLLGLIIIMPVLGHATWHLYRRVVRR
jgi:uncharacterized membrane protein